MSKQNDVSIEETELLEEEFLQTSQVDSGPKASIVPISGSLERVMNSYSHCNICGGRLHFNHTSDFSRNTTQEKAICPECGLDSRQVLHRLQ